MRKGHLDAPFFPPQVGKVVLYFRFNETPSAYISFSLCLGECAGQAQWSARSAQSRGCRFDSSPFFFWPLRPRQVEFFLFKLVSRSHSFVTSLSLPALQAAKFRLASRPPRRPLAPVDMWELITFAPAALLAADTSASGAVAAWVLCSCLYLLDGSRNQQNPQKLRQHFTQGTERMFFITSKQGIVSDTCNMLHQYNCFWDYLLEGI